MLERALYALEMGWHPAFSPAAASAYVPYDEANAPLFVCLFRCAWQALCDGGDELRRGTGLPPVLARRRTALPLRPHALCNSLASPHARPAPCPRRYIQSLSRRGLHRTALECCKLLLGLDGADPLGALCCADYLALRAGRWAAAPAYGLWGSG